MKCYVDVMISLQIEIDEETDRLLTEIAADYDGDCSKALIDPIHAPQVSEEFLDKFERLHHDELLAQRDRSERDFREGNWTTLEEVKRRNGL